MKLADAKFKKEFLKAKQSNRDMLNRSALTGMIDPNAIQLGKSPDRSKNMSVYEQRQINGPLLQPSKSPYLGSSNITGSGQNKKKA